MITIGSTVEYRDGGNRRRVGEVDAMSNNGGRLYRVNDKWFPRAALVLL